MIALDGVTKRGSEIKNSTYGLNRVNRPPVAVPIQEDLGLTTQRKRRKKPDDEQEPDIIRLSPNSCPHLLTRHAVVRTIKRVTGVQRAGNCRNVPFVRASAPHDVQAEANGLNP